MKEPHRELLHFVEPALFAVRNRASGRSRAFIFPAPYGRRRADKLRENPLDGSDRQIRK